MMIFLVVVVVLSRYLCSCEVTFVVFQIYGGSQLRNPQSTSPRLVEHNVGIVRRFVISKTRLRADESG